MKHVDYLLYVPPLRVYISFDGVSGIIFSLHIEPYPHPFPPSLCLCSVSTLTSFPNFLLYSFCSSMSTQGSSSSSRRVSVPEVLINKAFSRPPSSSSSSLHHRDSAFNYHTHYHIITLSHFHRLLLTTVFDLITYYHHSSSLFSPLPL